VDTCLAVCARKITKRFGDVGAATPLWQFGGSADLLAKKG